MRQYLKYTWILFTLSLTSCGIREEGLAPVEESRWHRTNQAATHHKVSRGETLYAIAFRYEKDYHMLADINHLKPPYTLRVGQSILLKSRTRALELPSMPSLPQLSLQDSWIWPVQGRVLTTYAPRQGKKGIDIAGKKGSKVRASASGVVAYAGNGLPGYGNLIILKHDKQFLTAYAHNHRNLVHEGQNVSKGQAIADIGVVDRRFWGVHFEIRKLGEPVNPLQYLKKKT